MGIISKETLARFSGIRALRTRIRYAALARYCSFVRSTLPGHKIQALFQSPCLLFCTTYLVYAAGSWQLFCPSSRFFSLLSFQPLESSNRCLCMCGPAGHYQTWHLWNVLIDLKGIKNTTHCQSPTLTGVLLLSGWLWHPLASRLLYLPQPPDQRGFWQQCKPSARNQPLKTNWLYRFAWIIFLNPKS